MAKMTIQEFPEAQAAPSLADDVQIYPGVLLPSGTVTIRQKSSDRFLDAYQTDGQDFKLVTRTKQDNDTQRWIFSQVGAVYTIVQKSNQRFMDAYAVGANDFGVVTRRNQNNDTQRWVVLPSADGSFTIQQLSSGRFLDAYNSQAHDFAVVTRGAEESDSKRWLFDQA